ncbi:hypothetical protein BgiMline_017218 [Biomphalaria glabrata]|nr:hypothetical protein BgiMline_004905 [Biomphalaria glabrata]
MGPPTINQRSITAVTFQPEVNHSSDLSTRAETTTRGPSQQRPIKHRSITAVTYQPEAHHSRNYNQRSITAETYQTQVHHSSNLSTRGSSQQKLQPEVHHSRDLSITCPLQQLPINQKSITAVTYQPEVHDNSDPSCQILVPS